MTSLCLRLVWAGEAAGKQDGEPKAELKAATNEAPSDCCVCAHVRAATPDEVCVAWVRVRACVRCCDRSIDPLSAVSCLCTLLVAYVRDAPRVAECACAGCEWRVRRVCVRPVAGP